MYCRPQKPRRALVTPPVQDVLLGVHKGDAEGVKRLVQEGAALEVTSGRADERGLRPLYQAALAGDVGVAREFVRSGADVHAKGLGGFCAVHYAAKGGHVEALKVLQELRCELRPLTDARETALHVAADFGNSAAVKWPVEEAGFNEASLLRGVGSALEVARSAREMAVAVPEQYSDFGQVTGIYMKE
ncbi:putative ankyrin repeat protein RF_0381 [Penaeus japonicus]|uniref:putative ankyrin repeat protein RF_0381 n=1 Tax=Penaeus japonicus TaxID=27405 RepID=UPI001C717794|nr:putative ankyrin repeat protein RF_0381 [Penaeus japonicus]